MDEAVETDSKGWSKSQLIKCPKRCTDQISGSFMNGISSDYNNQKQRGISNG